jgi:hypothetical protein
MVELYQYVQIYAFLPLCITQVGSTTMSSTEALKAGLRGKALKILHYYRDMLWQVHTEQGWYTNDFSHFSGN